MKSAIQRFATMTVATFLLTGCETQQAPSSSSASRASLVDIEGLGALSFPNSGSKEAQDPFFRGVLLLHSFEYEAAAREFRRAQDLDEDFALAYWGEAMTFNHPLWRFHDPAGARAVLARLAPTPAERRQKAVGEREKLYLDSVELLFSEQLSASELKAERDLAYMESLQDLLEAFPDDDEARAFYALSILGSVDGGRDFATYMKAAATAQPVFDRNPRHPGAAHYIIHSFDDPIHAPLGLPAAEVYADVAPNAAHAQHMTSHIFVALGLWERVVEANIRARDTQDAQLVDQGQQPNLCGHYSTWLHYGHLELGQLEKAEVLLDACYERVQSEAKVEEWQYFANMRARQIIDTEEWEARQRWVVPIESLPADTPWGAGYPSPRLTYQVTNAFAELSVGIDEHTRELIADTRPSDPMAALQVDQLEALVTAEEQGLSTAVLDQLRSAAETEASLPFQFGPPVLVKPGYELFGEALLLAGEKKQAEEAFRQALKRTPNRRRAVLGFEASRQP